MPRPGGANFGRTVPIEAIGTDRERFDTWTQANADATNAKARELRVERKAMVKDVGYASQPLDGIWLRAPYLHNGSVPSLTALLLPPGTAPEFWRGCDIYDPTAVGFRATPPDDDCPRAFRLDVTLRGERQRRPHLRHRPAPGREGRAHRVPENPLKAFIRLPAEWFGPPAARLPRFLNLPAACAPPAYARCIRCA